MATLTVHFKEEKKFDKHSDQLYLEYFFSQGGFVHYQVLVIS